MQLSLQKSLYQPVYTIKKKETENDVCGNARLRCTGVMGAGGSGLAGNFGGGETQHCNAVTCCASAAVPGTAAQGRKSGCEGGVHRARAGWAQSHCRAYTALPGLPHPAAPPQAGNSSEDNHGGGTAGILSWEHSQRFCGQPWAVSVRQGMLYRNKPRL